MKKGFVEIGVKSKITGEVFTCKVEEGEEIFYSIVEGYESKETPVNAIYLFESDLLLFSLPENYTNEMIDKEFFERYEKLESDIVKKKSKKNKNTDETLPYCQSSVLGYNKNKKKVKKYEY